MPNPTAGFSPWLKQDPAARDQLVIAAWQAKGSARRYLAGIGDERRPPPHARRCQRGREVAGNGTNPFFDVSTAASGASEVSVYVSALEAEIRSLRKERKQLAEALAAEMLKNPC